ncbi:MAG: chitosanase [Alphaproteobacteria bacterium]|jgi:chitosanase|nr:chitosanase [Rhodobiaceae bacterium]MBG53467.1 chitosanase [Rhodobiaceae bacterium]MBO6541748.1 chitosanase [Alphaproteobacteria bacterium]MBO6628857.1 chitosanase [Alphaproteobacteria bacterium]MDF1625942.1 peptidoglycan-binding protein [Parvibaculaceae bacterium]
MSVSGEQKNAAQAIVNIFETGKVTGDYGRVTLLPGDTGHLTYGRAQTTLASGNLYLLLKRYVGAQGAAFARHLEPFLPRLADIDVSLDFDMLFRTFLESAGDDPVMQTVQDTFFDDAYWEPASKAAASLGLREPLSFAIVYDSHIHGSWSFMRDRTIDRHGRVNGLGERKWCKAYVTERRNWLKAHRNSLLQKTIYRMDVFLTLIEADNWQLKLPMTIRGVRVDAETLRAAAPVRVTAEDAGLRTLKLTDPPMTGNDVRALETALVEVGYAINIDGVFDRNLDRIVRERQAELGLDVDGIIGPISRAAFGL